MVGPVVTASGLLFIAATKDGKFRAFDKKTGKLLWETQLPVPAFATPATYEINGETIYSNGLWWCKTWNAQRQYNNGICT
ncbi:MAG: hypothetical protein WDO71_18965 [Bacteroidota bacterium]